MKKILIAAIAIMILAAIGCSKKRIPTDIAGTNTPTTPTATSTITRTSIISTATKTKTAIFIATATPTYTTQTATPTCTATATSTTIPPVSTPTFSIWVFTDPIIRQAVIDAVGKPDTYGFDITYADLDALTSMQIYNYSTTAVTSLNGMWLLHNLTSLKMLGPNTLTSFGAIQYLPLQTFWFLTGSTAGGDGCGFDASGIGWMIGTLSDLRLGGVPYSARLTINTLYCARTGESLPISIIASYNSACNGGYSSWTAPTAAWCSAYCSDCVVPTPTP